MDVVVCLYNIDSPCLGPVSFLVMMLMMISFHLNVLDLAFFSWLLVNLLNGLLLTNCWHSICKIFPVRHTLINWCDRETALTLSKIFLWYHSFTLLLSFFQRNYCFHNHYGSFHWHSLPALYAFSFVYCCFIQLTLYFQI